MLKFANFWLIRQLVDTCIESFVFSKFCHLTIFLHLSFLSGRVCNKSLSSLFDDKVCFPFKIAICSSFFMPQLHISNVGKKHYGWMLKNETFQSYGLFFIILKLLSVLKKLLPLFLRKNLENKISRKWCSNGIWIFSIFFYQLFMLEN